MKSYIVAPNAESDLQQIWRYLLDKAGPSVANRIQDELIEAFERIADAPGRSHTRTDLTNLNVLFFSVYQYMIVYKRSKVVEIVAVLHGKRDVRRILKARSSR